MNSFNNSLRKPPIHKATKEPFLSYQPSEINRKQNCKHHSFHFLSALLRNSHGFCTFIPFSLYRSGRENAIQDWWAVYTAIDRVIDSLVLVNEWDSTPHRRERKGTRLGKMDRPLCFQSFQTGVEAAGCRSASQNWGKEKILERRGWNSVQSCFNKRWEIRPDLHFCYSRSLCLSLSVYPHVCVRIDKSHKRVLREGARTVGFWGKEAGGCIT